ncbi:hypothetical protein ABW20_dc0106820 [Dactylellina cionopaga]|nr:hypothetical protein ABW20_dc0106820 [Dactylellina cionopaga]
MPISHFSIPIPAPKWEESKKFYTEALKPIGYNVMATFKDGDVVGMGEQFPDFWFNKVDEASAGGGNHFAFTATNKSQVQAFHAASVSNGGTCNGPPGPRPHYGPSYYAAFIHDPLGNNVEVVTHSSE